jgi:hypothetical protein
MVTDNDLQPYPSVDDSGEQTIAVEGSPEPETTHIVWTWPPTEGILTDALQTAVIRSITTTCGNITVRRLLCAVLLSLEGR